MSSVCKLLSRSSAFSLIVALAAVGPAAAQLKLGVPEGTYPGDALAEPPRKQKPKPEPEPPKKQQGEPNADGSVVIDGVIVNGKRGPKLPTLGTDRERDKDSIERAADWYKGLEHDINKLSPDAQQSISNVVNDDPNPNHNDRAAIPPKRDGADYRDPISATQAPAKKK